MVLQTFELPPQPISLPLIISACVLMTWTDLANPFLLLLHVLYAAVVAWIYLRVCELACVCVCVCV